MKAFHYRGPLPSRYSLHSGFFLKFLKNSTCLRSVIFAMLPSCTIQMSEESHLRLSLLREKCRFPSTWNQELSCGWLGQIDSLPVIWVYPEKDVSIEIPLFLFAFFSFSSLFLFAFCGVCQWN